MSTSIRFAQFNASLNRGIEGQLVTDLSTQNNAQSQAVAEIIQRNNPDVLLINEFDYDAADPITPVQLFQDNYLSVSQNGATPVEYPYVYIAPSNTGIPSGFDLDNNGSIEGPGDAFGFGFFSGQFGMVLLSKYPIDTANIRTFQEFLWKDMPDGLLPDDPTTAAPQDWYSPEELELFRLSSKSHWDIPIQVNGETIHVLASHPTPPVFDGAEDRNGTRNHDEIRFWSDYITPDAGDYIYDDAGNAGGLALGEKFVVMGDQNADPEDGDSTDKAILQLLDNPLVNTSVTPASAGGPEQATLDGDINASQTGDPRFDTADFSDTTPGNLRTDYVLPSNNLAITDAEVFWPTTDDPLYPLVGDRQDISTTPSSDHSLVSVDVMIPDRQTVTDVEFLGEVSFPTGYVFEGTEVGGLSGIAYDAKKRVYYAISDDRSQINPARFYTLSINLRDGRLDQGDIALKAVTTLKDANGNAFPAFSLDPEDISLAKQGTVYISSEGEVNPEQNRITDPFMNQFGLNGQQLSELPIPKQFLASAEDTGIRNNLAFESLTISTDGRYLYTATENALKQDGPAASLNDKSLSRILKYDLQTGKVVGEFVYEVEAVSAEPIPADGFATNGLVDLLAIDNNGTLLALERSFSVGVGNTVKLYEIRTQGALDVSILDSLAEDGNAFEIDPAVSKREIFDFSSLGIPLDNLEGIELGPQLADGRQSLIVVSDNNFSRTQSTQVIALALDLDTIPVILPEVETTQFVDSDETSAGATPGDADDPAIWVNPIDASKSLVVTALKDGGLAVLDLKGQIVQNILPADYSEIRYNNVDILYGFQVGGETVDLAIASDRENDTLAIYQINPTSGLLSDVTSGSIPATIFGIDDGEQTAYGLATYTSPVSGKHYVFVSQRSGNQIAQLELADDGTGGVTATLVRSLTVPIPPDSELEDAQVEGMVVDRETGYLYVGQENFGIWKFSAEVSGSSTSTLVDSFEGDNLEADVEGLTIYYADNGTGYLLASSQGDNTFAVYSREGDNKYLGNFTVGASGNVDSVEESDGADVINLPLGSEYPFGLLVVQDGANDPQVVSEDEGELENISTGFKFVPWENVATAFSDNLKIDPSSANPRDPVPSSLPNGVASGDTTQTSTVLWTRSTVLGQVKFEYSTDPNFETVLGSLSAIATDPLQPVKVELAGLTPGTQYYYRVTNAAEVKLGGTFNTSDPYGGLNGLRFGVSGDWRGELSPYPAISNAADRNLEFFVEHGDTIYADFESPVLPGVDQATTLEEYRLKQSEVYGTRNGVNTWSDLRASTSILATIDDHEVINDFAGGAAAINDPRLGTTEGLVNDTELYENGLQAFQDYNPIQDQFYGQTGENRTSEERKLYRNNTYGNDAATYVLDARSFRDEGLASVTNPADPDQVGTFLTQSFDASRTMLGQQQLTDLKQDLLDAEAKGVTWKFMMVPEPIQNLGVVAASDRYEGYAAERTEILKFIDDHKISNVVFIAADIHGTLVNNLTYRTSPFGEQIATGAFEITTGSVAFDAPFGQTVIDLSSDLGLVDAATKQFYDSLPIAADADNLINDKDDFLKNLVNQQLATLGYDPLGLENNLAIADGQINAKVLQGDYVASHTYGWTEFDIDPISQKLTVTTYGIEAYTEAELLADPAAILNRQPQIVSQFEVTPGQLANRIIGTNSNDQLIGNDENNVILGLSGNDTINGGKGDDRLFGGAGNDSMTGGGGQDTFVIPIGQGTDRISDFDEIGKGSNPSPSAIAKTDKLKFEGAGLTARNMLLTQTGADLEITFDGIAETQVVLQDFAVENLDNLPSGQGNILFDPESSVKDSFDVFDADSTRTTIWNRNTTTFLNNLANNVQGFDHSDDVMNGQAGNDTLTGLTGNDTLRGGQGRDTLIGGQGNDLLEGGWEKDILLGGNGDDFLVGGAGNDTLTGNIGNDWFDFRTGTGFKSADLGSDRISDFSRVTGNTDKIILSQKTFTAGTSFASVSSDNLAASSQVLKDTNLGSPKTLTSAA